MLGETSFAETDVVKIVGDEIYINDAYPLQGSDTQPFNGDIMDVLHQGMQTQKYQILSFLLLRAFPDLNTKFSPLEAQYPLQIDENINGFVVVHY